MGFHYLKYGIAADQKYLIDFVNKYSNLVINARSVAHTTKSLFLFIHKIFKKVGFIIDPETHMFQHDPSTLESSSKGNTGRRVVKKSIMTLIDEYGKPVNTVVNARRILLPDYFTKQNLKSFCKRVIDFQMQTLQKQSKKTDVSEYYDFLVEKKKISSDHIQPEYVIAPYFYLDGYDYDEWLKLNIECIEIVHDMFKTNSIQLASELVLSKDTLNDINKKDIITKAYSSSSASSIFLWIDSFSEHDANIDTLSSYVKWLSALKKPVVNLHGGYFSILLNKLKISRNLIGVTHALGYGEDRAVVPVGGGVPTAKFYIPSLHKRVVFRNALESVKALGGAKNKESYLKHICNCPVCDSIIKNKPSEDFKAFGSTKIGKDGREYATPEAIELCLKHYMYSKIREYSESIKIDDVRSQFNDVHNKLKGWLPDSEIAHCKTWISIIENPYA